MGLRQMTKKGATKGIVESIFIRRRSPLSRPLLTELGSSHRRSRSISTSIDWDQVYLDIEIRLSRLTLYRPNSINWTLVKLRVNQADYIELLPQHSIKALSPPASPLTHSFPTPPQPPFSLATTNSEGEGEGRRKRWKRIAHQFRLPSVLKRYLIWNQMKALSSVRSIINSILS